MAHTPGPWEVGDLDRNYQRTVIGAQGSLVAVCAHECLSSNEPIMEANACLIAAAPELLAALNAAVGFLENARIDLETGAPKATAIATIKGGLTTARAAIQSATGNVPLSAESFGLEPEMQPVVDELRRRMAVHEEIFSEIARLRDELEGMPGKQYVDGALYALDNLRDRLSALPSSPVAEKSGIAVRYVQHWDITPDPYPTRLNGPSRTTRKSR